MRRLVAILAGLLLSVPAWGAESVPATPHVGDTFQIRHEYDTRELTDGESSGSSNGHTTIIERIVAVRSDGLELEYDLLPNATADERARQWQLPARILRPAQGSPQLLNGPELASRLDAWLKRWKMPRESCGQWIFTWNAFKIECDPESVIAMVEPYNLRGVDLREGSSYRVPEALAAAPLESMADSDQILFFAEMPIDTDKWRGEQAQSDIVVAQIMGKKLTLDDALRAHSQETISGEITVTFEVDQSGQIRWRRKLTRVRITGPDGKVETKEATEKVERWLLTSK